MVKRKWIDKNNATTFTLVHRPQNDPLIHDEEAPSMVLKEIGSANQKVKTTHDLEEELGASVTSKVRNNEGEAAMYGIYFDDTEYDYMQHLREMGTSTEAVFIEAPQAQSKQRSKQKTKLEDALREDLPSTKPPIAELLPKELLPSETLLRKSYQDQQDIPDSLAGFQPDIDPRLREVLEALEDDEYVDDDEELFGELTKDGEADEEEFYAQDFEDGEEDEWDSDATEKPTKKDPIPSLAPLSLSDSSIPQPSPQKKVSFDDPTAPAAPADENPDWMAEYSRFKKHQKAIKNKAAAEDDLSSLGDTMSFGSRSDFTFNGSRRTRRRHAKNGTISTGYSMSSSALHRTEGLTLLDDRFDKIQEEYDREDDEEENIPPPTQGGAFVETRPDFDSIMDNFLENYSVRGKAGRVTRGKAQSGIEQLDEIRRGLGSARLPPLGKVRR